MMYINNQHQGKAGFTLIEAVMVLALLAILTFSMANFIVTMMSGWVVISGRDTALGRGRSAMNRILTEIRRVRNPASIVTFTSSDLAFQNTAPATVEFQQSGTNLLYNGTTLVTNLVTPEGLRFTYLGSTNEVTAVKQNIRSIRVWLFFSGSSQQITLESSARLRNLK
jgi:prepilin-type N-terminal cleavage/methylation domain-containing protein